MDRKRRTFFFFSTPLLILSLVDKYIEEEYRSRTSFLLSSVVVYVTTQRVAQSDSWTTVLIQAWINDKVNLNLGYD